MPTGESQWSGIAYPPNACFGYTVRPVLTEEAKRRLVVALEESRRVEKEIEAQDRERAQEREARLADRLVQVQQRTEPTN